MKRLQAAMRDASAKRARENRHCYRVGSVFKGCHNCGDYTFENVGGREVKRYTSGFNVFRSYAPCNTKWTYACAECGAKDLRAWEDANDIGTFAIRGTRDAVREQKYRLRKEALKLGKPIKPPVQKEPSRSDQIATLQAELARLEEMIKGRQ